jgi:hypothetical protein
MESISIITTVLTVVFALILTLIGWLKYREHLHAHRREREEHSPSEFPLHSRGRR